MEDGSSSGIAASLRRQAEWCRRLGSSLYAFLLEHTAADVEARGPCWDVLHDLNISEGSAPGLRFMGAVHRIVLSGLAPELALYYPSMGGTPATTTCWDVFRITVATQTELLREWCGRPVQTNEVARSAALIGGFLVVARESNLPLRIFEIGSSAGLNLRWDHFYYEAEGKTWGDPASPVRLVGSFDAGSPPFDVVARISERCGCDLSPVDPGSEDGRLTLLSYVWADQKDRLDTLRGALQVAHKVPARIEQADGGAWVERNLSTQRPGAATVVFHSIVAQYMGENSYKHMVQVLRQAGAAATKTAPLAWLRMEPGGEQAEVRLTTWPEERERTLAATSFHGRGIRWLD
jgi:hypothetical protein